MKRFAAIVLSMICASTALCMNIPCEMSASVSRQTLPDLSKFELLRPKTVQTFEGMAYYDVDLENEAWDLFYSYNYRDAYEKFKKALCSYKDNQEWETYLTHLVDSSLEIFCSQEKFNDQYIFGLDCLRKSFSSSNLFPPVISCCEHFSDSIEDNVENLNKRIYFLKQAYFWTSIAGYDKEANLTMLSAKYLKKKWR